MELFLELKKISFDSTGGVNLICYTLTKETSKAKTEKITFNVYRYFSSHASFAVTLNTVSVRYEAYFYYKKTWGEGGGGWGNQLLRIRTGTVFETIPVLITLHSCSTVPIVIQVLTSTPF
jgi:hypothetical protein